MDGATITDGDGTGPCTPDATPGIARCSTTGVDLISVNVLDLDDIATMNVAPPKGTIITGGAGYDVLTGGAAKDVLQGGPGGDRMSGSGGNDTLNSGTGGLDPNSDACVLGQIGNNFLDFPICFDEMSGAQGEDIITYADRDHDVYVDSRVWAGIGPGGTYAVDGGPESCITTDPYAEGCEVDSLTVTGGESGTADPANVIIGGNGDDELIGNFYDNTLIGGPGADTLCGGMGTDAVSYMDKGDQGVNVTLNGSLPTDPDSQYGVGTVDGQQGNQLAGRSRTDCRQVLKTDPGFRLQITLPTVGPRDCVADDGTPGEGDCVGQDIENITGANGNDTLIGSDPDSLINEGPQVEPRGFNVLKGMGGNDLLDGRQGPDVFEGGNGTDTVTYADRAEPVNATIDGKGNDGSATSPELNSIGGTTGDFNPYSGKWDDIKSDVENIIGGAGGDLIAGSEAANTLTGGGGNDDIDGSQGNDSLSGAAGADSVRGGEGNDALGGDTDNDVLAGDAGTDTLSAGAGDDLLAGGTGPDTLSGGEGSDTADWASATSSVSVTVNGLDDDGTESEHDYVGSDIEGANGGLADDSLVLGAGDGFIAGGPGNDYFDGGPGADSIEGNDGLDEVDYSSRGTALSVDVTSAGGDGEAGENDDVHDNVEQLRGGPANDMLVGAGFVSVLIGNGGDDQLYGNNGDDQLFGGPGNDGLEGGNDADTLDGSDGDDNLFGSSAGDTLLGGGGNDSLDGGAGPDSVSGGGGTDTASYAARSKALNLSFDGNSNDGESGEKDVIKMDVENTKAGAGADIVNALNERKNSVSCGRGTDSIAADTFDEIAGDCERIVNTSPCKANADSAPMSASGVVTLRVSCTADASGTLQLRTGGKVKTSKQAKAKRLTLGRKAFKLKRGQSAKVKIRIKSAGKRVIKRSENGINAQSTVTVRQKFGVRSMSLKKGDRLKIKAKK